MDKFIIAQIFGFAGLACSVSAYQCKKHKSVMILKTSNEMLFAFQYFFLGTYTGMAMNIISSVRNLTFSYLVKKEKNTLPFRNFYMEELSQPDCNFCKAFDNGCLWNEKYKISSFCDGSDKHFLVDL